MGMIVDRAEQGYDISLTVAENAVWAPDPATQIATNLVIIVVAMLSTSVGFAPGLIIAMIALFLIGVAILRAAVGYFM